MIGGLLLALAVVGAIVVPSLVAGPEGVFAEVPVALPPESGVSVVHARPTLVPHDRLSPVATVTARPKAPRVARVRATPKAVPATASPRPVSRPAAPTPAPVPTPAPSSVPAPEPTAPGREILVSEPEPQPATPPHGQPVVDEPTTPEPSKNEGEKKGHEKNEPQGNAYGRDDDEQGGPKPGRGPRD